MDSRRSTRRAIFCPSRSRFFSNGQSRLLRSIIITFCGYFILLLSIQFLTETSSSLDEVKDYNQFQRERLSQKIVNETPYHDVRVVIKKGPFSVRSSKKKKFSRLSLNRTNLTREELLVERNRTEQQRLYYSFIDVHELAVDLDYLDQKGDDFVELPNFNSHPYSRIVTVKGDSSIIVYNRIPESYEFTMGSLLGNMSCFNSFEYIPSQIFTPFSYSNASLTAIARSLDFEKHHGLLYERHIHFFDYYSLNISVHPVWINLVPDPIYRVAAEFQHSREVCRQTSRCFVRSDALNETLDECVRRRSPRECISSMHGVSRMLPFFCGSNYPSQCQEESSWAMKTAKRNIDFFYTVVGVTEHFYKFLYVLEKLLPRYFKLSRLVFMNQYHPEQFADIRDINVTRPSEKTIQILRPFLAYEYELYEYIKKRFLEQYQMLVELDS